MSEHRLLVLYYSRHGSVKALADKIAQGIESQGCEAVLRTVPEICSVADHQLKPLPDYGDPYVTATDLQKCDGLALGSPVRFGNMAAEMKYFWDSTTKAWISGSLVDKPAIVFTSSTSMHGGNESTLLTIMLPLLHHGMMLLGTPYTEPELSDTTTGGTPYGPTHVAGKQHKTTLSDEEAKLAFATGKRLAITTKKLNSQYE